MTAIDGEERDDHMDSGIQSKEWLIIHNVGGGGEGRVGGRGEGGIEDNSRI